MANVVITGGSRGIGAAAVKRFADRGNRVWFLYAASEEAAKALGINRTTLIKWENGQVIPGTIQLIALANIYKIPIDYIFVPKATT